VNERSLSVTDAHSVAGIGWPRLIPRPNAWAADAVLLSSSLNPPIAHFGAHRLWRSGIAGVNRPPRRFRFYKGRSVQPLPAVLWQAAVAGVGMSCRRTSSDSLRSMAGCSFALGVPGVRALRWAGLGLGLRSRDLDGPCDSSSLGLPNMLPHPAGRRTAFLEKRTSHRCRVVAFVLRRRWPAGQ